MIRKLFLALIFFSAAGALVIFNWRSEFTKPTELTGLTELDRQLFAALDTLSQRLSLLKLSSVSLDEFFQLDHILMTLCDDS